jgi:large subunit ribosomal protein L3
MVNIGIFGKKNGMTQVFDANGMAFPVTKLKLIPSKVIGHKTTAKHGYNAIVVGYSDNQMKDKRLLNKAQLVEQEKAGQGFYRKIKEFRLDATDLEKFPLGSDISSENFGECNLVDVTGKSKGKGFAGAMKRHGFGGLRATHGVSISHRSIGSTGNRTEPGKVFKGKKMPGHMGNEMVTVQNLWLAYCDNEHIYVGGSIPGANNDIFLIKPARKLLIRQVNQTRK